MGGQSKVSEEAVMAIECKSVLVAIDFDCNYTPIELNCATEYPPYPSPGPPFPAIARAPSRFRTGFCADGHARLDHHQPADPPNSPNLGPRGDQGARPSSRPRGRHHLPSSGNRVLDPRIVNTLVAGATRC